MPKWVKLFKNLKTLKSFKRSTKLDLFIRRSKVSYLEIKQFTSKPSLIGNLEFTLFFVIVCGGLIYIHKNKSNYGETVRLIAAGIATHIVVDCLTYLGDKLNTKVKVEKFYKKKATNDLNFFFDKKFSHFKQNKQVKRKRKFKSIGHVLGELHFRGLQAAIVFVCINSVFFYGLYKNIKYYLDEKFNIKGFLNFFIAAGLAQFVAMIFAFPLENIKTRMQASNFSYDSFFKYYNKLIKGKPLNVIYSNFKNEYSGFVSHLVLYVLYESVTFAIYESIMKMKLFDIKKIADEVQETVETNPSLTDEKHENQISYKSVLLASVVSGVISAVVTNPVDVYQINKQINPKFNWRLLTFENMMIGMKERIVFITFLNLSTFFFLETIGHEFNVRLE